MQAVSQVIRQDRNYHLSRQLLNRYGQFRLRQSEGTKKGKKIVRKEEQI
jgi:hypothetical protein